MMMHLNAYLDWQYDLRARHPEHYRVKAISHRRSEWVRGNLSMRTDLNCEPVSYARFDVIPGKGKSSSQPAVVFIHGGFWRSGDKSECAFLAEPFHQHGISTVLLNYSLAPAVSLDHIINEVRASFVEIMRQARQLDLDPDAVVVGGHSAGGHLAAKIASTDWTEFGLSKSPLKAGFGISGIYDPRPLAQTNFQPILTIPADSEHLVAKPSGDTEQGLDLVACGALETAELKAQTQRYAEQVKSKLNRGLLLWVEARDHYSILHELARAESELFRSVLNLFR